MYMYCMCTIYACTYTCTCRVYSARLNTHTRTHAHTHTHTCTHTHTHTQLLRRSYMYPPSNSGRQSPMSKRKSPQSRDACSPISISIFGKAGGSNRDATSQRWANLLAVLAMLVASPAPKAFLLFWQPIFSYCHTLHVHTLVEEWPIVLEIRLSSLGTLHMYK